MILADENLPPLLIQPLRSSGIEIYSVREHQRGISDKQVISLSKNPPRIILTEGKDFAEWVFAHNEKEISVILLRYARSDLAEIISTVSNLIHEKGKSLFW